MPVLPSVKEQQGRQYQDRMRIQGSNFRYGGQEGQGRRAIGEMDTIVLYVLHCNGCMPGNLHGAHQPALGHLSPPDHLSDLLKPQLLIHPPHTHYSPPNELAFPHLSPSPTLA